MKWCLLILPWERARLFHDNQKRQHFTTAQNNQGVILCQVVTFYIEKKCVRFSVKQIVNYVEARISHNKIFLILEWVKVSFALAFAVVLFEFLSFASAHFSTKDWVIADFVHLVVSKSHGCFQVLRFVSSEKACLCCTKCDQRLSSLLASLSILNLYKYRFCLFCEVL